MTTRFPYRAGEVPEYLTTREVAALHGVSTGTVLSWARRGLVDSHRADSGRHPYRFPSAQFADVIAAVLFPGHAGATETEKAADLAYLQHPGRTLSAAQAQPVARLLPEPQEQVSAA